MYDLLFETISKNIAKFIKSLGYLWYFIDPREHLFETVGEVPDYYKEVTPAFIFIIILEQVLHFIRGKKLMRMNDSITNICQGILVEIFKIPLVGIELILYTWIYNNCRIYALPWNSVWTWIICLIATDFFFYWMHRGSHQISILWQFHEPHHSSEDFNLTTPLRLSVFTSASFWLTYFPMAFFIPPSTFLVHYQLNTIYQYWLHSEYIPHLGVLEQFLITPSHHRVHHGRNRRCIDKNFGSIFVIWDKIFGTFEAEGSEKIVYGVTKPLQTFNPIHIQTVHLQNIWKRLQTVDSFMNKLSIIFKGPGWKPGTSWIGNLDDIPEPKKDEPKYDPKLPKWLEVYIAFHTAALVIGYLQLILNISMISNVTLIISCFYIIFTTVSIGLMLDISAWFPTMEMTRCLLYYLLDAAIQKEFSQEYIILYMSLYAFRSLFLFSFVFWIASSSFMRTLKSARITRRIVSVNYYRDK